VSICSQGAPTRVLRFFTNLDESLMEQVEAVRAIEPLCMLWCIPGFLHGEWSHAFKLLR
jgi:hypothetical protein